MVEKIILNEEHTLKVESFEHRKVDDLHEISIMFPVSSEEYHDVTVLLYKGSFDVGVPEKDLSFYGTIQQYYTSVTDLYKEGQVGDFFLTLRELKE